MRTQFHFVGLLGLVAGGLVGTAGCDNTTAGQTTDSSAPPQLVHVLVQDARYLLGWPNRASSLDLIDNNPFASQTCTIVTPKTATEPQLDDCVNEFLIDQVAPDVSCTAGLCADPLKVPASGVPIPLPMLYAGLGVDMRDPGGGIQMRLVFDKVLDSSIETVTMDPSKAPGKTDTYKIMPGIIELDDETGPFPAEFYLDNGGSPAYSADFELVPLGPALVIKPMAVLDPETTYTIKILNPGALKDREGNAAVALGGGALGTSYKFKTETLTPAGAGVFGASPLDFPDFTMTGATIVPNDVVQISFFGTVAGDTAVVNFTASPGGINPIAYSDRGNDPTACLVASMGDPGSVIVDIFNANQSTDVATATPVNWPAGDYTFTITVKSLSGSTFTSDPMTFTVAGMPATDPMADPNIVSQHVFPSECTATM